VGSGGVIGKMGIGKLLRESGCGVVENCGWSWWEGPWCGWDRIRGCGVVELMR
jgi:hypothetical protein